MATAPPPAKKPAPPPPANGSPTAPASSRSFYVGANIYRSGKKIGIYGPGGIGKSELALLVREVGLKPMFFDIGDSTSDLGEIDRAIPTPDNWTDFRAAVQKEWPDNDVLVIDDLTKAQEMCADWVVQNIKHEKEGKPIRTLADYGYGKGFEHVYNVFMHLFGDLDAQARKGKHIICIAHEQIATVKNPLGEDYDRFEPRLQIAKNSSVRHRFVEWCHHMFFIGYDIAVNESGKAMGGGTRTIYTDEMPGWIAKSRSLHEQIPYEKGVPTLWKKLFNKE